MSQCEQSDRGVLKQLIAEIAVSTEARHGDVASRSCSQIVVGLNEVADKKTVCFAARDGDRRNREETAIEERALTFPSTACSRSISP